MQLCGRVRIAVMQDVVGCLGCDLVAGRCTVPGGILHETTRWIVNHAVGRLNLGTLIVAPRDHVVAIADLDDVAVAELGPLLRDAARVVEALCRPEQTYVCVWSHGRTERRHLHILVQPVTAAIVAQYGGLRAEQLQARLMATGAPPDPADVEQFCLAARSHLADALGPRVR
jgi:ATP adenylyltransferase